MIVPIEVVEGAKNDFTFVWDKPTPHEQDMAIQDKVTLAFIDDESNPISELSVSLHSKDDLRPEKRQIYLGLTDQSGRVYWSNYETGTFVGWAILIIFEDDMYSSVYAKESFTFEVTGAEEFTFTWISGWS